MRNDFAIFIITHGRPRNQKTLNLLKQYGYTGKWYLVIDDEDKTQKEYMETYTPDNVVVFNKDEVIRHTDTGLQVPYRKFAVFARNACEYLAELLDLKYFIVMDDDLKSIRIRYDENGSLKAMPVTNIIDEVIECCLEFMDSTNLSCTGLGFYSSYMSGVETLYKDNNRNRICCEVFIRRTTSFVKWRLNMLEDLITSLDHNKVGDVWLQLLPVQVEIYPSTGVSGGNSDAYTEFSQFHREFMPVIVHPDCNKMTVRDNKWYSTLDAPVCCPKIISWRYKR